LFTEVYARVEATCEENQKDLATRIAEEPGYLYAMVVQVLRFLATLITPLWSI
jgi:hypothetical protein